LDDRRPGEGQQGAGVSRTVGATIWSYTRWTFLGLLGLIVLTVGSLAIYLAMPISTAPFRDVQGKVLPRSIASVERWRLNGIEQSVILRGRDVSNPILIWIHGGPGTSETALFRHYNAALEDHFLVVYWTQRYAGQSLDPFGPAPTSEKIGDYVSDLGQLIDRLRSRFHCDKVVLVAHSAGTVTGLLFVERHPERVAAYVGVGQVADTQESEKRSYAFVLSQARSRGDVDAIARLTKLGPPPWKVGPPFTPRDLLMKFGGSFHADMGIGTLALVTMRASEANWRDFAAILLIAKFNGLSMHEFANASLDQNHTRFAAPIFFLSGRYDHQVDATLAERYLERIDAPEKRFVWFEKSGHGPPFEEPDKFNEWVVRTILPLARRS
jgi:pimeloyl-ACP methyl ester carboxylesterase